MQFVVGFLPDIWQDAQSTTVFYKDTGDSLQNGQLFIWASVNFLCVFCHSGSAKQFKESQVF